MVSLYNYLFIFSVRDGSSITKKQARIKAMTQDEAQFLLTTSVKNIWIIIDIVCEGKDRNWMIAGNFGSSKSHVESVTDWSEPVYGQTPFQEFVQKYRVAIRALPLPDFVRHLTKHEGYRVPTDEQLEILADETGERIDVVRAYAYREFYAYCASKLLEVYGKPAVMRVLGNQAALNEVLRGDMTNVKAALDYHFPKWAILRMYPMTAGELFFFHDMQNGIVSNVYVYRGETRLGEFSKKAQRRFCNIDERFAAYLAKEAG